MARTLLTVIITLLLALPSTAQQVSRRGPGCWRTSEAQRYVATRLAASRQAGSRSQEITKGYFGKKKGLVILAEFTDKQFKAGNDKEKYEQILNEPGYTTSEGFKGSVADYFHDQSGGLFELQFDVVGPYTTKHGYAYYGENDKDGYDLHPEEMVMEMCLAADNEVNFADYDWDGDGEVDEVFVVYAGKGEADGGSANTIWPHMWALEAAEKQLTLDGTHINVYACANELTNSRTINGIGTFCHEFSHCLGLPDVYDVEYTGNNYCMGSFDVMSDGTYNGNGFTPAGYTAFEKMSCGWQSPITLGDDDVVVDNLKPMNQQGDFYIIYNDGHPDEFYLIENRQKNGWDKYIPSSGLIIYHIDYDEDVWYNNIPNTIYSEKEALELGYTCGNDHLRITFFHANNSEKSPKLYPYYQRDSLTATSEPAATLFHANSLGTKLMQGALLDIHQNGDDTMGFTYRAPNSSITAIEPLPSPLSPLPSKTFYTLDGRVAGTTLESLPHGIYIMNKKKFIVH